MKLLVTIGGIALCLLAGAAHAADKTYDWSGIYLGASAGYAWGDQDWKLKGAQDWGPNDGEGNFSSNQFEAGGHLGAQYQWKWLVLGGEVGIYKGPYKKDSLTSPYFPAIHEWTADIYLIAKGTAKVGFAYKRLLTYVKGGYAGAFIDTKVTFNATGYEERTIEWHNGWTVGGGIEYALTKHLIIGAEYNYIDLLPKTHTHSVGTYKAKVNANVHQALLRLSLKF